MSVMPRMFCIGPSLLGYIPNKQAAINMEKPICLYSDHIISIGKSKEIKIFYLSYMCLKCVIIFLIV